jgi:glutaredoxin
MNKVVMYSKDYCPYCARAKALLEQRGVTDLEIIQIDREPGQRDRMIERTGRTADLHRRYPRRRLRRPDGAGPLGRPDPIAQRLTPLFAPPTNGNTHG